jgi:hypothetical protein
MSFELSVLSETGTGFTQNLSLMTHNAKAAPPYLHISDIKGAALA